MSEEDVPMLSNYNWNDVIRVKENFHYIRHINVNEVINDEKVKKISSLILYEERSSLYTNLTTFIKIIFYFMFLCFLLLFLF